MDEEIKIEIGTSFVVTGIMEKPIKIPSQLFPLQGAFQVFMNKNTEPFPDDDRTKLIKEVYDSIKPGIGTCYTNAKVLIEKLAEKGIQAEPFVGWVFIGGGKPTHHCFTVVDKIHILDFILAPSFFYTEEYKDLNGTETKEKFTDFYIAANKMSNSEKSIFGQADPFCLYVASPCKPEVGVKTYQKLIKAFPKHPCFRIAENGASPTQNMLFEKMKLKQQL